MKLVIQIPCYNEQDSLPVTLGELPRTVAGFDQVEWLIIDDGSEDDTVEVARKFGVDHIISLPGNKGLAIAFMAGIDASLAAGADVIVNTDADNQYSAADIPKLVEPILNARADMVIGARPVQSTSHFSKLKKILQKMGSWVVRKASGSSVLDAPSGFRAFSRDAALEINVFSSYTYTLETIIQAGQKNRTIVSVPISTNPDLRESRLLKSIGSYVRRSIATIVRMFVVYKPFPFFLSIGLSLFCLGLLLGLRFLVYWWLGQGDGHVQSLILSSVLLGIGFQTMLIAFVTDLLAVNRRLLEEVQYRLRRADLDQNQKQKLDH